jgi:hypothetical protein
MNLGKNDTCMLLSVLIPEHRSGIQFSADNSYTFGFIYTEVSSLFHCLSLIIILMSTYSLLATEMQLLFVLSYIL